MLKKEIKLYHSAYETIIEYRRHGTLHKIDSPAIIWVTGYAQWWRYGLYAKQAN